jgi:hypothetical protein
MHKFYKYGEWDIREDEGWLNPDTRLYEDSNGELITGILEDFWYYAKGDPRNNQYVENGRRLFRGKHYGRDIPNRSKEV